MFLEFLPLVYFISLPVCFSCIISLVSMPPITIHLVLAKIECFALLCSIICISTSHTHLKLCPKGNTKSTCSVTSPFYFLSKDIFSTWLKTNPSILPTKTMISGVKNHLCFTWELTPKRQEAEVSWLVKGYAYNRYIITSVKLYYPK